MEMKTELEKKLNSIQSIDTKIKNLMLISKSQIPKKH